MIKQIYLLLIMLAFFTSASCSDGNTDVLPDDPNIENPDEPAPPDDDFDPDKVKLEYDDGVNCAFHVKIAIDKEGWEMRDEEFFKTRLKSQWEAINERFNALDKKDQLKRNYIFIPDLDDIIVYEFKDADSHWEVPADYASRIDFNKYQCLVAYDFVVQEGEGGGGCGDDGKGLANILVINPSENNIGKFYDHFDESTSTVAAITHELGHFRGIYDLYVVNLSGSKNPINGEGFRAPDGVMNDNTYGPIEDVYWNDYEILCLNYNLARKEYRLYDTCMWETFTDNIEISVTEGGEPVNGFTLNLYNLSNSAIESDAYNSFIVEGSKLRKEARDLFWYGSAYWQYNKMYLLEVVSTRTGKKGYRFLPYYEPHQKGLEDKTVNNISGKSVLELSIDIE